MIPYDQIIAAGEEAAIEFLQNRGYKLLDRSDAPGGDILMQNTKARVLVRVKSAIAPDEPSGLTQSEKDDLIAAAARHKAIPWPGFVQLNEQFRPARKIKWTRLDTESSQ